MTYSESDLLFTFPDDWIVRKYDSTVAYQSLSGHGLKGVDFLCLSPDGKLWLIEVKNYRMRKNFRATRRSPGELAVHVGKKFSDTKRLIRIVNKYMRRRWWIALRLWWYGRGRWSGPSTGGPSRSASNYRFWWECLRRLGDSNNVNCLLWLETPELSTNYGGATGQALEAYLEPGNVLRIAEMQRPGNIPIQVVAADSAKGS